MEARFDLLVAKKLRQVLQYFPQPDSLTEVVCLSQTVRIVRDIENGERMAVVVPSDVRPIPWHEYLLQNRYATLTARSVLVGEALKPLEADFTEILHNYLGMPLHGEALYKLTKAILYIAKSLKQHCDTALAAPFGLFAAALVNLLDAEPSNDMHKKELEKRNILGKKLFLEVVQEGVASLREDCEIKTTGIDGQLQRVFDFMGDEENYESIVREWATAARTRLNRNAPSHPFSGLTNHEERQIAIDYFGSLVNSQYCGEFKNVALLSKLHLELADIKESSSFGTKKANVIDSLL